jgi:hypothetical protein
MDPLLSKSWTLVIVVGLTEIHSSASKQPRYSTSLLFRAGQITFSNLTTVLSPSIESVALLQVLLMHQTHSIKY